MHWIHEKYIISLILIHWSSSELDPVKHLNKWNAFMCPSVASQAKNWYNFWGVFNLTHHGSDHDNCVWGHMQLTWESTWPLSVLGLGPMSSSVSLSPVFPLSAVLSGWRLIKADTYTSCLEDVVRLISTDSGVLSESLSVHALPRFDHRRETFLCMTDLLLFTMWLWEPVGSVFSSVKPDC